jgi:hypothetical protein
MKAASLKRLAVKGGFHYVTCKPLLSVTTIRCLPESHPSCHPSVYTVHEVACLFSKGFCSAVHHQTDDLKTNPSKSIVSFLRNKFIKNYWGGLDKEDKMGVARWR